ncbi:MAG TPA: alkaline phosphatase family protein [Kofleriaceae bacterium]|jgi:phospholipase C|nr:alkaline phosphatase family protein [Kofleriaceae bacterium]
MLAWAACGSSRKPGSCDGPCPASQIHHLVVLVQENHTFDNYFAKYCTGAAGVSCGSGRACCEAGPAMDPTGAAPVVLDDARNADRDPNHERVCEVDEMHGGAMDRYATGSTCSDPGNVAYADQQTVGPYWELADHGALADRYFQPLAGESSANMMYFARAQFVFDDNDFKPDALGQQCSIIATAMEFQGPTIGDLLDQAGVTWAWYDEGYQAMADARAMDRCPKAPTDCVAGVPIYPCVMDPSDLPVEYYANLKDDPRVLRDFSRFAKDLDDGTLPQVVFVRALGYKSEHAGLGTAITPGISFVTSAIDLVEKSDYAPDTLVLVTWDEGGGFFDHVAPPPDGSDGQPYGTRVPLIATGPMAKAGAISHVTMEHSSIVRFIEWNWLGAVGQLGGRDAHVANLGSMIDAAAAGVAVPD